MKLIDSKVELLNNDCADLENIYKTIELVGRVCTRSEDKITENSYVKFVDNLKKANHGSCLEHGTIYLTVPYKIDGKPNNESTNIWSFFYENPYSVCTADAENIYITTNYRVIFEGGAYRHRYLKYITPPTKHALRFTFRFTCSRAIANEFVRHRHFSFMQESTRYVNYKNEVEFIKPEWSTIKVGEYRPWEEDWRDDNTTAADDTFMGGLLNSEIAYKNAIKANLKPQQARDLLPLATKTTLYMTGTVDQWKHFLSLRSPKYGAQGVHPDAAKLADIVYDNLKEYINDEKDMCIL